MKKLFEGKRKYLSISIVGILSLVFFPIAVGLGLGWLVYKKVGNPKLKYSILAVVALFTLLVGSTWVSAITSRTDTRTVHLKHSYPYSGSAKTNSSSRNNRRTISSPYGLHHLYSYYYPDMEAC